MAENNFYILDKLRLSEDPEKDVDIMLRSSQIIIWENKTTKEVKTLADFLNQTDNPADMYLIQPKTEIPALFSGETLWENGFTAITSQEIKDIFTTLNWDEKGGDNE